MTAPLIASSSRALCASYPRLSTKVPAASRWFTDRLQMSAGFAASLLLTVASFSSAQAQTATFTAAQITLGSGFSAPYGVAVDGSGNVYVADVNNSAIDEIQAVNGSIPSSPTILTLGSGFNSPTGVAVDGSGNVYVADAGNSAVVEILAGSGNMVALGAGTWNYPTGVALDSSGDLFVADNGTGGAYEIVASGGNVSANSQVQTLTTSFIGPFGIAVDTSGNVYVADSDNNVVDKIVAVQGKIPNSPVIQPVGSGFNNPYAVALDSKGDLYVAQPGAAGAEELLAVNGTIPSSPTVVSLGSGFSVPSGVALDKAGNLYVADPSNEVVVELVTGGVNFSAFNIGTTSPTITFNFTFQTGGTISAPAVLTQGVSGLDFADAGTGSCTMNYSSQTYNAGDTCTVDMTFAPTSAGTRNGAVGIKDSHGNPIATAYAYGTGLGPQVAFSPGAQTSVASKLATPAGMAVDGSGSVYVADTGNNRVLKETLAGGSYSQSTVGTGLSAPSGVTLDAAGNIYIADTGNSRVLKETASAGAYAQSTLATGLTDPQGVAVDASGNVYIAEKTVLKETLSNGVYSSSALSSQGLTVNWIAVDGSGDLFLVDSATSQVILSTPSGQNGGAIGSGLSSPSGIAVDSTGNVFIADQQNNRIVKETVSGGAYTQSVPATGTLNGPTGLAIDGAGNVYVSDADNVVLKADFADAPSLTFVTPTPDGTIDTTDGALSVAVVNVGNASLTGGLSMPSNFTLVSGSGTPADCSTSLAILAGTSCDLSFEFTPGATAPSGYLIGDAVLTDNHLNASPSATQTIILGGTAGTALAATHFVVTASQSTVTAGAPFTLSVTAEDASGTVISSYNSTISLTSTDAQLAGGGNVTLSNGTGSYQVTLGTAGGQTVTATSTTGTALTGSAQLSVQAGAAATTSIVAGNNQSAHISNAFSVQLQLQVADAYGNPVSGATVLFAAPSAGASATFAAPYNSNASQTVSTTGSNGIATASIATANTVSGQYSVATTIPGSGIAAIDYSLNNLAASQYLVTVLTDDAGTAANCPDQANGTGNNSNCSLRDAVAAVNALPGSVSSSIAFAPALTSGGAQTLTLTNGALQLSNSVTVNGPGATLLSISGNGTSQILNIQSGVSTISGLTLTNGSISGGDFGAALYNDGTLTLVSTIISGNTATFDGLGGAIYNDSGASVTVANSTLSGNTAGAGGGIYNANSGTVLVNDSTISGNTADNAGSGGGIFSNSSSGSITVTNSTIYHNFASADGGGIHSAGTLSVINSTISANHVTGDGSYGGGIYSMDGSTLNVLNSVIAGNAAITEYADLFPPTGFTLDPSNIAGTDPSPTSLITADLAPLANYGGTTQTMVPLPGSPAICAGTVTDIPSGVSTDQRGDQRTTTYGTTACVDAGAVQTNYSLIFVQQPTDVPVAANIAPAPTVQLNENGTAFSGASATIALSLTGSGALTGGSASTTNGLATYSALSVSEAGSGDTLTASLALNSTTSTAIATTSTSFNVIAGASQVAFGTPPAANVTTGGNAGSTVTVQEENADGTVITTAADSVKITVSGPDGYFQAYSATAVNGIATFNLGSIALSTDGTYVYTATSGALTAATSSEIVSQAQSSTISVVSGSGQSTVIGNPFSAALTVKVLDPNNNPVSGAAVTFTTPASGPSANLLSYVVSTGADGTASSSASANGLASTTPYNVIATTSGNSANFSLTNTPATSSLTVTASPTGVVYGQSVTVKAAVSPAFVLASSPTGTVTFYDGTTALAPTVAVSVAVANDTIAVPTVGSHTYQAQYSGDKNFTATALKSATSPVVVSKASSTLNGPAKQPVTFPTGTGGTTQVTLVGQYSGPGISAPGGTVSFTVDGVQQNSTIAAGIATITIPASMPSGSYTINVAYAGDGNYNAAPSITIPFSITAATATTTTTTLKASPTTVAVGGTVTLTATVSVASGSTVPTGSVTFTSGNALLGTAPLSGNGIATYSTTKLTIGTDSIIAAYAGTSSFTASSSGAVQVVVTAALAPPPPTATPTTTLLKTSDASVTSGTAVVFTATITPATPVPTGTVIFSDGTTALNMATVNSTGVATYSTTTLAVGAHSITAAYSGNSADASSKSTTLTETITAVVAPPPPTQSFTIKAEESSISIAQGQAGIAKFMLTAVNGYDQAVTLTCSGLPADTSCAVPAPLKPTSAGTVAIVTITTGVTGATAKLRSDRPSASSGAMTALAGAGLAGIALLFGIPARKRMGRLTGLYTILMALALSGGLITMTLGCGTTQSTPPSTSTLTISATGGVGSAAVTQKAAVTVTITQ